MVKNMKPDFTSFAIGLADIQMDFARKMLPDVYSNISCEEYFNNYLAAYSDALEQLFIKFEATEQERQSFNIDVPKLAETMTLSYFKNSLNVNKDIYDRTTRSSMNYEVMANYDKAVQVIASFFGLEIDKGEENKSYL